MSQASKYRVGVLFGGRSSEHEVSLASAKNVMEALRQAGHVVVPIGITAEGRWLSHSDVWVRLTAQSHGLLPVASEEEKWELLPHSEPGRPWPEVDIIFPVLHGPYGEDGTVQGLLEMANLPYVGCGVLASAVAMDKAIARQLFAQVGLPQTRYQVVMRHRWRREPDDVVAAIEEEFVYPLFVKPANLGSSVGVSKARDRKQLIVALDLAARFDRKILIEEAVPNAREIEVSVLGNDEPVASIAGEIIPGNDFYDYSAKYEADTSELLIPAHLDEATMLEVRNYAVRAFQALECAGLARVDFLMDGDSGVLYLNEVNTMPGFTRISMYPKLWEASGLSYPELVDRLVLLALERHADRQTNCTTRN
ncbi:MAG: D-alanine--D-alanine ligase [Caldilineaceae bacterium]|nr:D-alanine--D-alanine ligase [Caldilineaceae bacterium]